MEPCAKAKQITLEVRNISDKISLKNILLMSWNFLRLLREGRGYDWVITSQDGLSTFWFGVVRRLLRISKPKHAILEFITREKGKSVYDWLKYAFLRFSLNSVNLVFCSARHEITYYQRYIGFKPWQTAYVPLYGDPRWLSETHDSKIENYILCAGRTLRDYKTLFSAIEGATFPLIVVTSPKCIAGMDIPANVKLLFDIPQPDLLELMKRARLIVLPLQDTAISSGQRVLLMAMALGKCCIVTRTSGTVDYVKDGEDGIFVEPYNPKIMRAKIRELWENSSQLTKIGEGAKKTYASTHGIREHARKILIHLSN